MRSPISPASEIGWRIQHHPKRDLTRLLQSSPDIPWQVVDDPDPGGYPSAWRTYRACLESLGDETHLLIAQDDTVCIPGFKRGVEAALEQHPEKPISFFHGSFPMVAQRVARLALQSKQPFWEVPRGRWIHTVCLLWPAEQARDLLEWSETKVRADFRGDDSVLGRWATERRQTSLVTTLSLVEHPDDMGTLVSSPMKRKRTAIQLAQTADEWISLLDVSSALPA